MRGKNLITVPESSGVQGHAMSDRTSINGTIDDVASFFRVSVRTAQHWKKERIIRAWSEGRNVIFDEEAVLDLYESRCTTARRMEPGELREIGRREWRSHLEVRNGECGLRSLEQQMAILNREVREIRETLRKGLTAEYAERAEGEPV